MTLSLSFPRIATALTLGLLLSLSYLGGSGRAQHAQPTAPAPEVRFDPIPSVPAPMASEAELQRVYEFAAHHGEVLKYIPCFCGCETVGHKSAESCFVLSRGPDGFVAWNKHGAGCRMCLDVAEAARELHAAGHPVREIRRQIVERFYKTRMTPTPPVPEDHAAHAPVRPAPHAAEHRP